MMRKINHLVRVGKTTAPSSEANALQAHQVQFNALETNQVSSAQIFGFASSPVVGCDVVLVCIAGDNGNAIVVASNDQRYRPKNMLGGETQIYDNANQYIYLRNGTKIVINANNEIDITAGQKVIITANTEIDINAPQVTVNGNFSVNGTNGSSTVIFNGNIQVNGTITATGDIKAGTISLENHHHTGVQSGGSQTGLPV